MSPLDVLELAHQGVVLGVRHLGSARHVVAVIVVLDRGPKLFGADARRGKIGFFRLGRLVHGVCLHSPGPAAREYRPAIRLARRLPAGQFLSPMASPDPLASGHRDRPRFEELAAGDDEGIDVALGAALIARDVYQDLDVPALLRQFDALAAPVARLGFDGMTAEAQALEMAHYVYERQGFAGNETDYYDPRNSLLPDVLERRVGI